MAELAHEWQKFLKAYHTHIRFERGLSSNTIDSYLRDVRNFGDFIMRRYSLAPCDVEQQQVEEYMEQLYELSLCSSTAARMLSSVKSFYEFMLVAREMDLSPAEMVSPPSLSRHLPDLLTVEQIDSIIEAVDSATTKGLRDRALLELLYSCGLRASEAVGLRLSDLFFDAGYLRVVGKGDKQRLVPLSGVARRRIELYLERRGGEGSSVETLFLNNRGAGLTRVMLFTIVRRATAAAGVEQRVSPHTFRHSFATHLLEGGASIREVQEMLGHESITTTEIYTHVSRGHLLDSLLRLTETY